MLTHHQLLEMLGQPEGPLLERKGAFSVPQLSLPMWEVITNEVFESAPRYWPPIRDAGCLLWGRPRGAFGHSPVADPTSLHRIIGHYPRHVYSPKRKQN